MLFDYTAAALFVFLLPATRVAAGRLFGLGSAAFTKAEVAIFIVTILAITKKWQFTTLMVTPCAVRFCGGLLLRQEIEIPIRKIALVEENRDLLDVICKSVTVKINTEGGKSKKADVKIRMSKSNAKEFLDSVGLPAPPMTVRFSAKRILVSALAESTALGGLVLVAPAVKRIGDLLGYSLEQIFIDGINEIDLSGSSFTRAVNAFVAVLAGLYAAAFFIALLRRANFEIKYGSSIVISGGLIAKHKLHILPSNIKSLSTEQTMIMQLARKGQVLAHLAGKGKRGGALDTALPLLGEASTELLGREIVSVGAWTTAVALGSKAARRYYRMPAVCAAVVLAALALAAFKFREFSRLIVFLGLVAIAVFARLFAVARHKVRNGKLIFGNVLCVNGAKVTVIRKIYFRKSSIGVIRITRWPYNRRTDTCSVKVFEHSKGAESVGLKYLPYGETISAVHRFIKNKDRRESSQ